MKRAVQETSVFNTNKVLGRRGNISTAKEMLGKLGFMHCEIINSVSDVKCHGIFSFISQVNVMECTCVTKINPNFSR